MYKNFYLFAIVGTTLITGNNSQNFNDKKIDNEDSFSLKTSIKTDMNSCPIPPGLVLEYDDTDRLRDHLKNIFLSGKKTKVFKVKAGYLRDLIDGLDCNAEIKISLGAYEKKDIDRYKIKNPSAEEDDIKNMPMLLFVPPGGKMAGKASDISEICPPPSTCDFPLVRNTGQKN